MRPPLSVSLSLSDVVHHYDDSIDASILIYAADGGRRLLIAATVTSRFWAEPRVRNHGVLRVAAPIADVDALVVAIFDVLGAQIREYGTEHVSACYPDFRRFLADHLPPAVAARLDTALCRAMPETVEGDTISFTV